MESEGKYAAASPRQNLRGSKLSETWARTWAGLEGARDMVKGGPCPSAQTSWSVAVSVPRVVGAAPSRTWKTVGGRRRGGESLTSVMVIVSVAVAVSGGLPIQHKENKDINIENKKLIKALLKLLYTVY